MPHSSSFCVSQCQVATPCQCFILTFITWGKAYMRGVQKRKLFQERNRLCQTNASSGEENEGQLGGKEAGWSTIVYTVVDNGIYVNRYGCKIRKIPSMGHTRKEGKGYNSSYWVLRNEKNLSK